MTTHLPVLSRYLSQVRASHLLSPPLRSYSAASEYEDNLVSMVCESMRLNHDRLMEHDMLDETATEHENMAQDWGARALALTVRHCGESAKIIGEAKVLPIIAETLRRHTDHASGDDCTAGAIAAIVLEHKDNRRYVSRAVSLCWFSQLFPRSPPPSSFFLSLPVSPSLSHPLPLNLINESSRALDAGIVPLLDMWLACPASPRRSNGDRAQEVDVAMAIAAVTPTKARVAKARTLRATNKFNYSHGAEPELHAED